MGRKDEARLPSAKRLNAWIPESLVREAKAEAARRGITLAEFVARAVYREVHLDELRKERK